VDEPTAGLVDFFDHGSLNFAKFPHFRGKTPARSFYTGSRQNYRQAALAPSNRGVVIPLKTKYLFGGIRVWAFGTQTVYQ
jgi:hypothetical protein